MWMSEGENIKTAYSQSESVPEAVQAIQSQLDGFEPHFLLVFASSAYDQSLLCQLLQSAFPETQIMGCSTAGEVVSQHLLQGALVVMAFNSEIISDIHLEVVEDLTDKRCLEGALKGFESHFGVSLNRIDHRAYAGLVLIDGMSMQEERFIESLGDKTNLVFIGGSAGDDLHFQQTHVYANGKAYSQAAVLAVFKPRNGFDVLKTQSFSASERQLVPTQVQTATRTVLAFNDQPAAQAYAEALGVSLCDLPAFFMRHPLGLMADGEPFVRSPQKLNGMAVDFYCRIVEGVPLTLLNPLDIIEDTQQALRSKLAEIGPVQGVIDFQCILRTLQLRQEGKTENYIQLFEKLPVIGFSTYGEAYLGHMNQTSTLFFFK